MEITTRSSPLPASAGSTLSSFVQIFLSMYEYSYQCMNILINVRIFLSMYEYSCQCTNILIHVRIKVNLEYVKIFSNLKTELSTFLPLSLPPTT